MEKDTSIKVIYIAGNGYSGSTLLDIILGSTKECFSTGELTFIKRDTIREEYCSCKKKISKCEIWSNIFDLWETESEISYQRYQHLSNRYQRNKTTIRTYINFVRPSYEFKQLCMSTLKLFQAIQTVTGYSVLIDSSKSPQRIAILSKIVDLQVIHLCRDFKGVLNSSKRPAKKNIQAGIEVDIPARRTWKVLVDWIFTNLVTEIFSLGVPSKKVLFTKYVHKPELLREIDPVFKNLNINQSFSAPHMLAGNALRLKEDITINPNKGFQYKQLEPNQITFANWVDKIFPFWS